jgi:hypothetical protein
MLARNIGCVEPRMSRMCLCMCLCMCRSVGEPRARRVRLGPRPWDAVKSGSLTLRTKHS